MTDGQGLRGGVDVVHPSGDSYAVRWLPAREPAGGIGHGGFRCSPHPLLRRARVRAGGGWGHRRGEHGEDVPQK